MAQLILESLQFQALRLALDWELVEVQSRISQQKRLDLERARTIQEQQGGQQGQNWCYRDD